MLADHMCDRAIVLLKDGSYPKIMKSSIHLASVSVFSAQEPSEVADICGRGSKVHRASCRVLSFQVSLIKTLLSQWRNKDLTSY